MKFNKTIDKIKTKQDKMRDWHDTYYSICYKYGFVRVEDEFGSFIYWANYAYGIYINNVFLFSNLYVIELCGKLCDLLWIRELNYKSLNRLDKSLNGIINSLKLYELKKEKERKNDGII